MPPRRTLDTTLLLLALAPPLGAIDLIPNRYDDPPPNGCNPGDCSFREAVIAANDAAGADRVILSTGTYRLTLPGVGDVFSLTGSVDVRDTLEIAGAGASLTFIEAPGLSEQVLFAPLASIAMTLRGVTVQLADKEGMVLLADGPNVIEDCQFRNNASTGAFGGLEVHNSGSTTIRRSAFIGNGGPGLFIVSGTADIENVTVSGSTGNGLALNPTAVVTCRHCTLAGNAGSQASANNATLSLQSSIVQGTCSTTSGGAMVSLGGNIEVAGNTCGLDQANDHPNVAVIQLLLGALGNFGGPTPTHLPGPGSLAIHAVTGCPFDDQRGARRAAGACDIGAAERNAAQPATPLFTDAFEQGNTAAWD